MKIFVVILLSIVIHFSFYFFINKEETIKKVAKSSNKSTNSKVTYVKIKAPVAPKQKIQKEIIPKKKTIKKDKPKKIKKKIVKKPISKPIIKHKKIIPKIIKKSIPIIKEKEIIKEPIEKILPIDKNTQTYLDLYGKDFKNFSDETKVYLIKNIKDIGSITKIFLEYPYMSIQAGQSGVNVVEFMLYPNGKISDLKIVKSSKYFLLDDNTIETIEAAYSDYPRPKQKTPIRIYIKYILN